MIVTGSGTDMEEGSSCLENIWCDVETQRFYCDLPELTVFLPTAFLNKVQPTDVAETVTEEVLDSELTVDDLEEDGKVLLAFCRRARFELPTVFQLKWKKYQLW